MQGIMEGVFDTIYLTTVVVIGLVMIKRSRGDKEGLLFGIMAVVLGVGDSFHLVPRVYALCTSQLADYVVALGVGKFITSITMTIFYVMLYYVWRVRYKIEGRTRLTILIYALAIARIVLCLFPQNLWTTENASFSWGIYRNIPFMIIGMIIIVLFYREGRKCNDKPYKNMWLTIVLSFLFYIPVVLWADQFPLVGMLMIPKTCAYVWSILIGYKAFKERE